MASPKRRTRRRASPKKRSTRRASPKKRSTKRMSPKKRSTKSKSKRRVSRKCTSPKSSKACKQWRKKMRGGSSCGTHKGAGYGKQKAGVKNSEMDSHSGNSRPKRASATKANVAISQTRKDREKRSQKIKLTKEFKKVLDVEIDRLADMMGTSKVNAADNLMDDIGMYMNTMTMGRRQQQSSSKQLPPSRINFWKRQPSRTEYTAQDVMARFK